MGIDALNRELGNRRETSPRVNPVKLPYPGRQARKVAKTSLVLAVILLTVVGSIGEWLPGIVRAFGSVESSAAELTKLNCPQLLQGPTSTPNPVGSCQDNASTPPLPNGVGANPLPNLSLPRTVVSSVDNLVGAGGVIQSSSDNLTVFNNAVGLRLLGGSAPHDLLLDPRLRVLGSYMFWEARANIGGVWTPLVPSSNTFTVLGTNATGTFVTRTMQVNSGSYSGTLTVAYKATSKGPLKWDLGFSPKNTGQYELVYSWEDLTGQFSLLSPVRQFSMNSARGNYTFSWSDVSSALNANASLAGQLFVLSIDLGIIMAGSRMQVDPSIVSTSAWPGASAASAYTFQRKVFYDAKGGYYWVFYYNGPWMGYRYSSDGTNWSPVQNMPPNVPSDYSGGPFYLLDIRNMGPYVVAAAGESVTPPSFGTVSIGYVVGTISGSTINWGATNYLGWNATCTTSHPYCTFGVRYVSSTLNPDGSLAFSYNWFGNYTGNRCGSGFVDAQSGAFAIYNGHNVVLSCNSGTGNYVGEQDRSVVIPADQNGLIRVVYEFHSGSQVELLSRTVDKNGNIGNLEIIDGSIADTDQFSATMDASFGVHVLYLTTSGKVNYAYRGPSDTSWSQPILDLFSGNANYPTITNDYSTNNVYAFAIQSSSVAMREKQSGRGWLDDSIIFPVTNETNPTNLGSSYASASSTNSTFMSLIFTAGTGPYDLTFARIPLETVWSPYSASSDPWDGEGIAPYGRYFANLGEYVSPSSGLLAVRQTDLTLPGRGLNLAITRVFTEPYSFLGGIAYNYESYPWAPMGNGWQLDFPWMMNATATYFPMFIHLSEGQGYRIPRSFWTTALPTAFENHEGLHFRMVRNGTGVFLYDAAGVAYKFDPNSAYRLTTEIDPLGNNLTFSYNANNQISSIRDTVGRTFLFCYASGRVTAIEQSGGSCGSETNLVRKVAFDYIGTALIVHDAAGRKTTYQYRGTSGSDQWLISQITYPTGWYTAYTYQQRSLGSQAMSSRVWKQQVYAGPTSPIRQFYYGYTQGPGDQVIGSSVGSVDGTTLVSATYYAFSFAGVTWNITDSSYRFVRGYQERFGTGGEVTRETVLVSTTQGYTNYYSYDLWGNRIYSRSVINPSANWYHESFNTYYNDGLPPGFNALQETFDQGNFSTTDNHWSVYNGTWLVKNGLYNGTSPAFDPTHQDGMFSWVNLTSPNVSVIASLYVTKSMASSDQRVGLFVHYPGSGTRKWALVFHNHGNSGVYLSLLDENEPWGPENPCLTANPSLIYNTWYRFNFTVSGSQAWGSATAQGVSCNVSGSFTSNDIASATGVGLYSGGYSALFDNITVTTVGPSITRTIFSNSFFQNGAPGSTIHGLLAGTAELQNGTGSAPLESYYGYTSAGELSQTKQLCNSNGANTWLTTTRSYDNYGNPTSVVDPSGNQTTYGYLSKYQYALPTSINQTLRPGGTLISHRYSYNFTMGTRISSVDPNGYNTTYQYDILGRLTRLNYPDGLGYIQYNYNDQANYVNITDENNWKTEQVYDGLGRLVAVERFSGSAWYSNETYTYDWQNRVLKHTDQLGDLTQYQYDVLGRPTVTTLPDQTTVRQSYDDVNNHVFAYDQINKWKGGFYDRMGRLINVIEQYGTRVTNYVYDEVGNLRQTVISGLAEAIYSYDNLNRPTQTSYPDGRTETYSYDGNGNLAVKVDRNGNITRYLYDSLNRISAVKYYRASLNNYLNNYTYVYDNNGNVLKLKSQNATIIRYYDHRNRMTSEGYSVNGGCIDGPLPGPPCQMSPSGPSGPAGPSGGGWNKGYAFAYSYSGEQLTSITYNDFQVVNYNYDGLGRLASISSLGNGQGPVSFTYYKNNQVKGLGYGNGVIANYTYDKMDRPFNITAYTPGNVLLQLNYRYNLTGTVASVTGKVGSTLISEQYSYDARDTRRHLTNSQLVLNNTLTTSVSYQYDNWDNRAKQTVNGVLTNYTYNNLNELTRSCTVSGNTCTASTAYSYDGNGNLRTQNVTRSSNTSYWTYTWDIPGNLIKVSNNTGVQGYYGYDGLGRRIEVFEGTYPLFYGFLGTETLAEMHIDLGGTNYDWVYGAGMRIAERYFNGLSNILSRYYHADALGSTRLTTDANHNVMFATNYLPFGQNNGKPAGSETYMFTGKPVSATTGLYYEYSRWYDPTVGRFISKDSFPGIISDPQSLNWYTYASDNPTTYSDPTGFVAVVSYGNGWGPPCPSIWKDPLGSFSCGLSRIPTPVADVVAGYDLAAWGLAECEQECGQLLGDAGRLSSGDVTIAKTGTTTSSTGSITAVTDTTRIATTGDEAASSLTSQITRDSNWVPNPGGRLGGLLHRNGVNDIFNLIKNRGLFPKTEYYVKDAGRFVDVVALDRPFGPGAQVLEAYQVGRMTLSGLPVSREIYAAADIIDKLGIDVIFVPYNV